MVDHIDFVSKRWVKMLGKLGQVCPLIHSSASFLDLTRILLVLCVCVCLAYMSWDWYGQAWNSVQAFVLTLTN